MPAVTNPPVSTGKSEPHKPKFPWQDALTIVGVLLAFGGMADMPLIFRVACFAGCAICLPISLFGRIDWPIWLRSLISVFVVLLMGFVSYSACEKSRERKIAPVIVWENPAAVNSGTNLSASQLNAKALDRLEEVKGIWVYNPTFETPMKESTTLSVQFSPDDKEKYLDESKTVPLVVIPAQQRAQSTSFEDPDAFAFQIPFLTSNMGDSGIDRSFPPRPNSPKGLGGMEAIANISSEFGHVPSHADVLSYLSRVLEYYMYREIFVIQDPSPRASFSYESNAGQSTHIEPTINVPDAREYSKSLWLSQIGSMGLNYNQHFGGPDDFLLPKALRLPAGVNVKMIAAPNGGGFTLRYERSPDLVLDFRVEFPGYSTQEMPPRGPFPNQSRILNDIGVTVQSDFRWHGDPSKGEEYREWAKNIVKGLKSRLATPQPKQL